MYEFFRKKIGAFVFGTVIGAIISAILLAVIVISNSSLNNSIENPFNKTKLQSDIVYDSEKIKVTVISFDKEKNSDDYSLKLDVENKTDNILYIYSDIGALNHYVMKPYIENIIDNKLNPNTTKSITLIFKSSEVSKYNIKEVGLIEFDLSLENIQRNYFDIPDICEYLYDIKINTNKKIKETFSCDEGLILIDNDKTLIKLINSDEILSGGENIQLYIENNTDKYQYYTFSSFRNFNTDLYASGNLEIESYPNSKRLIEVNGFSTIEALDKTKSIVSKLEVYDYKTIYDNKPVIINSYDDVYWRRVN